MIGPTLLTTITHYTSPLFADFQIGARSWLPAAIAAVVVITLLTLFNYRQAVMSPGVKLLAILLKVAGVLLLAICLIEPLFSGIRPRPGANLFVVLTDKSQSMTVQSGSRVRSDSLKQLLGEESAWRTRLDQDFDVRDYVFDSQLHHIEKPDAVELDGSGSALHAALDTIQDRFKQRPVAGVLLLSDGNATDLSNTEKYEFPVYPLVDEDSVSIKDVRIRQMNVSQTNFEASPVTVNAVVASQGFEGQELTARIVDQKGTMMQTKTIRASSDEDQEFRFRFRPEESGLSFHRLEVFPTKAQEKFEQQDQADELTLANNQRWMSVDRGGGPFRVLYVAGRPNWEFKFLRRALDEDDELKLTGLLRIAKKQPKFTFQDRGGVSDRNQLFEGFDGKDDEDAETYDQMVYLRIGVEEPTELADGFPKDSEGLFKYHAVIIDDLEAKFFTADQMLLLRRFVSHRGGGLLMLSGQESFARGGYNKTHIGEVLPVYLGKEGVRERESYDWKLTREGWLQDWTRLRLTETAENELNAEINGGNTDGVNVLNLVSGLKPGASLMAALESPSGQPTPALATQRFGKGRSAALLAGNLWRWNMHQQDPEQKDLQQLWRQIVRRMVADVPMRVQMDAERKRGLMGPVTMTVAVSDEEFKPHDNADVQVSVETPDGETIELSAEPSNQEAGSYTVDFWPREEGPYRAKATVTTSEGEVLDLKEAGWTSQPAADEFRELSTNRSALEKLAEKSGGELIAVDDLTKFVGGLPNRKVPVTETWVYPLWHQAWVMGLAICCLCGEWGLRRWRGLP